MTTHNCDNCMGVDPATCLFARPADTFVPWEETKRKMQVLQAAERTARISEGLNERLADGDTRDKVVYGTGQNGKGSVLDADELTRLFDGDTREHDTACHRNGMGCICPADDTCEAHSHPAGDGCTPRCVVPSDHDTAQCGCADTREAESGAFYRDHAADMQDPEYAAAFERETAEIEERDTRDQIAAAVKAIPLADFNEVSIADAAMSVVEPKLEALRAELSSSKAAHRAVWDKHQKRGQWIFDLQGENARLRAELEETLAQLAGAQLSADVGADENARLRTELDENTGIMQALRRQRDTAEATIERVNGVLDDMREGLYPTGKSWAEDLGAALEGEQS